MKEVARVLYGSQNYGLDTESSDRDYKVILLPTFDDLYYGRKVERRDLPSRYDPDHYSPIGIIRFHELLMSGNPNCIEYLFSTEWTISSFSSINEYLNMARQLFGSGYVAMVWDKFYPALRGLALNAVDRYGANSKTASRAYFLYGLMIHVATCGFVIDQSTFRGGLEFQRKAREIRLGNGKSFYEPQRLVDSLRSLFGEFEHATLEMARTFCGDNPDLVNRLQGKTGDLGLMMKRIVADQVKRDIEKM